tara:strand:- start:2739 stop:3005 length:267 start_codon:yes stop_codon:yes gene_type:complete
MEGIINIIRENIIIIIIVSAPTIYLMFRDFSSFVVKRNEHKLRLEEIAASERRLQELYKKIHDNKQDLAKKLKNIEEQLQDSIDNNEK